MSPADLVMRTTPAQCALALALPLSRESFFSDIEAGSAKDFVRGMIGKRVPEVAWADTGAPLAVLCLELRDLAAELGVATVSETTIGDLPRLFAEHQVVSIVAHWRGPFLVASDLLVEPEVILQRIRTADDPLSLELAERVPPSTTDPIFAQTAPNRRRTAFADLLNRMIISSDHPLRGCIVSEPGVTVVIDDLWLHSTHRDRLDRALPDMVRPGNRVEFGDGLYPPSAVAGAVPDGWTGIIDFVICHSAYLAHVVKSGRPERRVVANARKVVPGVRLRVQKELYRRLASGSSNYAVELIAILQALPHAVPQRSIFGLFASRFRDRQGSP